MDSSDHSIHNNALILVDWQNDFVVGDALAVPDGEGVIPIAQRLISDFDWSSFCQQPTKRSQCTRRTGARTERDVTGPVILIFWLGAIGMRGF